MQYSETFKTKMIEKMLGPSGTSAHALSRESGVSKSALLRWRNLATGREMAGRRGARRTAEEKVRLVLAAAGCTEEQLGVFLRKEGLHESVLVELREEVLNAAVSGLRPKPRGMTKDQKRIAALEKELNRKEKALAETAALLVLRGKLNAFLSVDEEGDTPKRQG